MPPTVETLKIRDRVIALLTRVSVANGYWTDVRAIETQWEAWIGRTGNKLPAYYVGNEKDTYNFISTTKFSSDCKVDADLGMVIFGRVRGAANPAAGQSPQELAEKMLQDTFNALARDFTLGDQYEARIGDVGRPAPWAVLGGDYGFQLVINYRTTIKFSRGG